MAPVPIQPVHNPGGAPWHDNFQNVVNLAQWLYENGRLHPSVSLFYMLRKPWKYNTEWQDYLREHNRIA